MKFDQQSFESYRDAIFQSLEDEGVMMHLDDDAMPDFLERLRAAYESGMPVTECAESIHAFIRESEEIGAVDTAKDFLHTAKVMEESLFGENGSEPASDRMILLCTFAAQRRMIDIQGRLLQTQMKQVELLERICDQLEGNAKRGT